MFSLLENQGGDSHHDRPSFLNDFLKNSVHVCVLESQNQKVVLGGCFEDCITFHWSPSDQARCSGWPAWWAVTLVTVKTWSLNEIHMFHLCKEPENLTKKKKTQKNAWWKMAKVQSKGWSFNFHCMWTCRGRCTMSWELTASYIRLSFLESFNQNYKGKSVWWLCVGVVRKERKRKKYG